MLLISAREALLARLILLGKATPSDRAMFARKAFGRFADTSKISAAAFKESAAKMLAASHLPELEASVLGYLYNHSGGLKLASLLDNIISLLNEVGPFASCPTC